MWPGRFLFDAKRTYRQLSAKYLDAESLCRTPASQNNSMIMFQVRRIFDQVTRTHLYRLADMRLVFFERALRFEDGAFLAVSGRLTLILRFRIFADSIRECGNSSSHPRRIAISSATIEIPISSGVAACISRPIGAKTHLKLSGATPSDSSC